RWKPIDVRRILFIGSDGNDSFTNNTRIPCTAYGDGGNDTLIGGMGNDSLFGGAGDDRLVGRDGDGRMDGGSGADKLDGGPGRDAMYGGEHTGDAFDGRDAGRVDTFHDNFDFTQPVYRGTAAEDVIQDSPPSCAFVAALAAAARAGR